MPRNGFWIASIVFFCTLVLTGCFFSTKSVQKTHHNVATLELLEAIINDEVALFEKDGTCDKLLVVFDIDNTLIQHGMYRAVVTKVHELKYAGIVTSEKDEYLTSIAVLEHKTKLVDKWLPKLVKTLQQKGVKTICQTNTVIHKFGKIEDLIAGRLTQLKNVYPALDFSNQFENYDDNVREPLAVLYNGKMEEFEFYKGILFSNKLSHRIPVQRDRYKTILSRKGLVLDCFLNELYRETGWQPSKIIFVDNDDLSRHSSMIKEVSDAMKYKNIDLTAIRYTQIRTRKEKLLATLSPKKRRAREAKIDSQFKALLEEERWLPAGDCDEFYY